MKMIQSVIIMLYTQPPEKPTNPIKLQETLMIEDPKYKVLEEKVEQYLKRQIEKRKTKTTQQVIGYRRQRSKLGRFAVYA